MTAVRSTTVVHPNQIPLNDPSALGDSRDIYLLRQRLQPRQRHVTAGQDIAVEGDKCGRTIWVMEGWVGLSKMLTDGRCQLIDILLPIDAVFSDRTDGTSSVGITALTDSAVSSSSANEFADVNGGSDVYLPLINKLSAAATARQAERILRLGQGTAYERIAYTLIELYFRLQAIGMASGDCFELPLTQEQIGELTGLSTVHVCRTLRRLVRNDVLANANRNIVINDMQALAEIGQIDLDRMRRQTVAMR